MKLIEDIKIDWHHNVPEKTTACVLTVTIRENNLTFPREFKSVAKCYKKDQFSKVKGRKTSLERVLKICDFQKPLRSAIWTDLKTKGVKLY